MPLGWVDLSYRPAFARHGILGVRQKLTPSLRKYIAAQVFMPQAMSMMDSISGRSEASHASSAARYCSASSSDRYPSAMSDEYRSGSRTSSRLRIGSPSTVSLCQAMASNSICLKPAALRILGRKRPMCLLPRCADCAIALICKRRPNSGRSGSSTPHTPSSYQSAFWLQNAPHLFGCRNGIIQVLKKVADKNIIKMLVRQPRCRN